ncbi:DUF4405 domain-containing protein [Maridesulfovibrio hydrothermalis]|uniref:Flavinylation-associated cytochrome domain-containing protein n=1 Tax=Maridesulfovibrio hydrothermalis AM13 = DSM 14728 TaxID=1121451 RepID=L0RAC8_9BACT|nr:DUF4405 domain-containing protein [Maridesulfovibrio hydrothermalis]CCO22511.1 conserved membrane protein of unknown function [Maridesulfovibrio hydrothermalis AM13 = DSM 14728]
MFRKITSLTSFFAIIILAITSIVLYFVPQGRVAYWADWTFLGLSKEQWGDIHICTGVLFLTVSILHVWLNWKPILAYLKQKAGDKNFSSPAFFISLILTLFVTFGTLAGIPPMKQVLEFSLYLKDLGEEKYGIPPYGHAELSPLAIFCKRMGLDADKAVASIKKAGLEIESAKESIKSVAAKAGLTPKEIHEIILKDQPQSKSPQNIKTSTATELHPEATYDTGAGAGIGKITLEKYCQKYNLDLNTALGILREKGAVVDKNTTIREIAATLGLNSPRDVGALLNP